MHIILRICITVFSRYQAIFLTNLIILTFGLDIRNICRIKLHAGHINLKHMCNQKTLNIATFYDDRLRFKKSNYQVLSIINLTNYSYFLNIIGNEFNSTLSHVIELLKSVGPISELRSIEIYLLLFFTAYYNKKTRCLSSNQYADIYVLLISFMN